MDARSAGADTAVAPQMIEPSIGNALPHFAPLVVFPLLACACAVGRLVDCGSARLFCVRRGSPRRRLRRPGAQHRPAHNARRPALRLQAVALALVGAVAGDVRLRVVANPARRPPGRVGSGADGAVAVRRGPVGLHHRPRAGAPARRVGTAVGRAAARQRFVPALCDRAHLHPPPARVHARRPGVAAQGRELLAVPAPRDRTQPAGRLALRAQPAGAAASAGLALHQPVLALLRAGGRVVRAGVLDGRPLGRAGVRGSLLPWPSSP